MIDSALLWFDDDFRRPFALKVSDAVTRYRERVGYEPTLCQVHPTQIPAVLRPEDLKAQSRRKSRAPEVALPEKLLIVPDQHVPMHHFLIGIQPGEAPVAVFHPMDDDDLDDDLQAQPVPGRRSGSRRRGAREAVPPAPSAESGASPKRAGSRRTAAAPARVAEAVEAVPAPKPARAARKRVAVKAAPVASAAHAEPIATAPVARAKTSAVVEMESAAPAPRASRKPKIQAKPLAATPAVDLPSVTIDDTRQGKAPRRRAALSTRPPAPVTVAAATPADGPATAHSRKEVKHAKVAPAASSPVARGSSRQHAPIAAEPKRSRVTAPVAAEPKSSKAVPPAASSPKSSRVAPPVAASPKQAESTPKALMTKREKALHSASANPAEGAAPAVRMVARDEPVPSPTRRRSRLASPPNAPELPVSSRSKRSA